MYFFTLKPNVSLRLHFLLHTKHEFFIPLSECLQKQYKNSFDKCIPNEIIHSSNEKHTALDTAASGK